MDMLQKVSSGKHISEPATLSVTDPTTATEETAIDATESTKLLAETA